jgi:hypothetical protein
MMCAQNFWFAACCTSFSPASQFGSDLGSHVLCWSWCLAPPVNLLASATEDFHLDLSLRWHRFWWVSPCASSVQSNQISTSGLYVVFVFFALVFGIRISRSVRGSAQANSAHICFPCSVFQAQEKVPPVQVSVSRLVHFSVFGSRFLFGRHRYIHVS